MVKLLIILLLMFGCENNDILYSQNSEKSVILDKTQIIPGDINNDGVVDIIDIILLVNIILNITEPTFEEDSLADVNSDEIINIFDVIVVVNIVLGTTSVQSVEWLEQNFPQLDVKSRLQQLNYNWGIN
tara:strand:- start:21 stop:407 length:387 start_codon:yes stop_codon:yes gene_type:complete